MKIEDNVPLLSVVLLSFNNQTTIEEALIGVCSQTYPNLEIIISDDASCDETVKKIQNFLSSYRGKFKIKFNQNKVNLGIAAHLNKAFSMVEGDLLILAAGDDISQQDRIQILFDEWKKNNFCSCLLYSNCLFINENSQILQNYKETVYRGSFSLEKMLEGELRILGATVAFSRDIIDEYPPIDKSVIHEDRVLPFRVLLKGGQILFVDRPLVHYRAQGGISRHLNNEMDIFRLRTLKNTLPDAKQRLKDLILKLPQEKEFIHFAQKTILDYEAFIKMIESSYLMYEYHALVYFLKGARFSKIIKLYLKLRFYFFYKWYSNKQYICNTSTILD